MFAKVIRRQADSPASMRLYNLKDGLDRISHNRIGNPSDIIEPMIRNRHWKCSGRIIDGLWMKESGSTSPFQYSSSLCLSSLNSELPQSASKVLIRKPAWGLWSVHHSHWSRTNDVLLSLVNRIIVFLYQHWYTIKNQLKSLKAPSCHKEPLKYKKAPQ